MDATRPGIFKEVSIENSFNGSTVGLKEGNAPFKFTVSRGRDDYEATFSHTQTMPAGMGIAIDFCKTRVHKLCK